MTAFLGSPPGVRTFIPSRRVPRSNDLGWHGLDRRECRGRAMSSHQHYFDAVMRRYNSARTLLASKMGMRSLLLQPGLFSVGTELLQDGLTGTFQSGAADSCLIYQVPK